MINDLFATKIGMTQAWTKQGKRLAVTRCFIGDNIVVGKQEVDVVDKKSQKRRLNSSIILEVGYGKKKFKNLTKPLRTKLEKSGLSLGVKEIEGIRVGSAEDNENLVQVGETIQPGSVLSVGDVVQVQGTTRGKGFTGAIKRHGFHGGPRTHGQSDRERAVGSIGAGTTPGRVWPGKKMPGRSGTAANTVRGLVVLHINPENNEIWLSGPVPGVTNSKLKITKTGTNKSIDLDKRASGLPEQVAQEQAAQEEVTNESN